MTSYPARHLAAIACPNCNAPHQPFPQSWNDWGAKQWTDGYYDAPMLQAPPTITRCSACRAFFWMRCAIAVYEDYQAFPLRGRHRGGDQRDPAPAVAIGDVEYGTWGRSPLRGGSPKILHPRLEPLLRLSEQEYAEALRTEFAQSLAQERHLRMLAWWVANDRHRQEPGDVRDSDTLARVQANMERLGELIDRRNPDQRVMGAELARQLGRFDQVPEWLTGPFPKGYQPMIERIRSLAAQGDQVVREVQAPDFGTRLRRRLQKWRGEYDTPDPRMLPTRVAILACPTCEAQYLAPSFCSYAGAPVRSWTDGYSDPPAASYECPISRCSRCKAFFWLNEANEAGHISERALFSASLDPGIARPFVTLAEPELALALRSGVARTPSQERRLRTLAWWAANRRRRDQPQCDRTAATEARVRANLERLKEMLDLSTPNDRVVAAEIARELGRFAETRRLLTGSFPAGLRRYSGLIRRLAREGDDRVREVR